MSLVGVATVTAPAGAFSLDATIEIAKVLSPSGEPDFQEVAGLFKASTIDPDSVEVVTSRQPTHPLRITMAAGPAYLISNPNGQAVRVLAATENEGDQEESYSSWDSISPTIDSALSTVSFDADPAHFSRSDGAGRRGIFILVLVPGT